MNNTSQTLRFWTKSLGLSLGVFIFWLAYVFIQEGFTVTATSYSEVIAATGAVMIGLSFALSSLSYFFDFADRQLVYRKYFGLVGYFYALWYSVMLMFIFPQTYAFGLAENLFTPNVLLGLGAMAILTFMALISNGIAVKIIGPLWWRRCLRLGYLAYAMFVVRAIYIEWDIWTTWAAQLDNVPPLRLIISIYATLIIAVRVWMGILQWAKKRADQQPQMLPEV
ncbi:hypothetical protein HY468_01445 [Candidatus Roizmanbacteria bacterium]|nr:hypothetical protein [Candidatus Roizmanbacteria bacterium]